jgi:hypothetical protein
VILKVLWRSFRLLENDLTAKSKEKLIKVYSFGVYFPICQYVAICNGYCVGKCRRMQHFNLLVDAANDCGFLLMPLAFLLGNN